MVVSESVVLASLLALVVLLALSAFFSASEIALFSLERHRLDALLELSESRASVLERLRKNPHRLLVTLLVGNNVVNVLLASMVAVLLAAAYPDWVAVVAATLVVSVLVLLFGELVPKSYGVANADSLSLSVARPVATVQRLLYPVVAVLDLFARGINRLTGGATEIEQPYVTREELEALLQTGERVGAIAESEHEMVQGVFDLSSTRAREVMVPRVDVVGVDVSSSLSEVLEICSERRLTRLPVYEGTFDHVLGIVDVRDAERAVREEKSIRDVLLPTLQVPETTEIDDLLSEMQSSRIPMVIVRDEFGEAEGVITVEDILEEIVGEIFEVGEERFIRQLPDGLMVKGEVTIGEINRILGVELPREGEFETVAGLINSELGRIGDVGDVVEVAGVSLIVKGVDGHRISRVRIRRLPEVDAVAVDSDGGS
ncbi:MAG: hemolysin family protein [Halobacteriota archaeon]